MMLTGPFSFRYNVCHASCRSSSGGTRKPAPRQKPAEGLGVFVTTAAGGAECAPAAVVVGGLRPLVRQWGEPSLPSLWQRGKVCRARLTLQALLRPFPVFCGGGCGARHLRQAPDYVFRIREVYHHDKNLSAQKTSALQRARLPQAHGNAQRTQGAGTAPCTRPRTPDPLMLSRGGSGVRNSRGAEDGNSTAPAKHGAVFPGGKKRPEVSL